MRTAKNLPIEPRMVIALVPTLIRMEDLKPEQFFRLVPPNQGDINIDPTKIYESVSHGSAGSCGDGNVKARRILLATNKDVETL